MAIAVEGDSAHRTMIGSDTEPYREEVPPLGGAHPRGSMVCPGVPNGSLHDGTDEPGRAG